MSLLVTTWPSDAVSDSTSGASDVTEMLVAASPTSSLKSMRRRLSTARDRLLRSTVLNPAIDTLLS
jgi:hypothetical protein